MTIEGDNITFIEKANIEKTFIEIDTETNIKNIIFNN